MMSIANPDLSGKLVLVTGATRGIGRAVAIAAARAGAELIITGRTIGALEEVGAGGEAIARAEVNSEYSRKHAFLSHKPE